MAVADQVVAAAQAQGVDPSLALEVATAESNLNQNAVSSAGAIGVMQLEPATAAQLGVNPYDVTQNILGGVVYLKQMLAQFGGDPVSAVAAYNCGPTCVSNLQAEYGSAWLSYAPAETQAYVAKVLGNVQSQYTSNFNPAAAPLPFVTGSSTLTIPAAPSPAATGSIWGSIGIAAAIVLGLGFILSES